MANNSFKGYDVFNLGTGNGNTVLEIIAAFENTTGVKLNYEIGPRRDGDVEKVWGDVTKSARVLNWTAKLGIDTMMASAWEWEKYLSQNPF
jgi:UDP-glucose 4-epimerase